MRTNLEPQVEVVRVWHRFLWDELAHGRERVKPLGLRPRETRFLRLVLQMARCHVNRQDLSQRSGQDPHTLNESTTRLCRNMKLATESKYAEGVAYIARDVVHAVLLRDIASSLADHDLYQCTRVHALGNLCGTHMSIACNTKNVRRVRLRGGRRRYLEGAARCRRSPRSCIASLYIQYAMHRRTSTLHHGACMVDMLMWEI